MAATTQQRQKHGQTRMANLEEGAAQSAGFVLQAASCRMGFFPRGIGRGLCSKSGSGHDVASSADAAGGGHGHSASASSHSHTIQTPKTGANQIPTIPYVCLWRLRNVFSCTLDD